MKVGFTFVRSVPAQELFSLSCPNLAIRAEELGFESCWISDHVVKPTVLPHTFPYSADHRSSAQPDTPLYDPWTSLATVAAVTRRLRLGTNVYVLPLRNPFVTARAVGTVDLLSEGRTILGIGVGWLEPEFDIMGETWSNRGARCDEILEIIKLLWSEETPEFHGKHYDFEPVKFEPKPPQKPTPPVLVSGGTKPAFRRAARWGDGWIADPKISRDHAEIVRYIADLARLREQYGRGDIPFEIQASAGSEADRDTLHRLEDIGVTRVLVSPWTPLPNGADSLAHGLADLERTAERLL